MNHKFQDSNSTIRVTINGADIWDGNNLNRPVGRNFVEDIAIPRSLLEPPVSDEVNELKVIRVSAVGYFIYDVRLLWMDASMGFHSNDVRNDSASSTQSPDPHCD